MTEEGLSVLVADDLAGKLPYSRRLCCTDMTDD